MQVKSPLYVVHEVKNNKLNIQSVCGVCVCVRVFVRLTHRLGLKVIYPYLYLFRSSYPLTHG